MRLQGREVEEWETEQRPLLQGVPLSTQKAWLWSEPLGAATAGFMPCCSSCSPEFC